MKLPERLVRFMAAFTVVGLVASVVPFHSSIASAEDGVILEGGGNEFGNEGGGNEGGGNEEVDTGTDGETPQPPIVPLDSYSRSNASLTLKNLVVFGGLAAAAGGAIGAGAGGSIRGAALRTGPVYDVTEGNAASFELIAKIIRNAEQVSSYRANEPTTAFWPTNESLVRVLGAERVSALQQSANQASAKQFLQALTVRGSYNLEALKAAAKSGQVLQTLLGQGLQLSLSGDTLLINGVPVLNTEYPASNGWVLATDGIIVRDDAEGTAAQSK